MVVIVYFRLQLLLDVWVACQQVRGEGEGIGSGLIASHDEQDGVAGYLGIIHPLGLSMSVTTPSLHASIEHVLQQVLVLEIKIINNNNNNNNNNNIVVVVVVVAAENMPFKVLKKSIEMACILRMCTC